MKYLKAIWAFCSYMFVPQRRQHPEDVEFTEPWNHGRRIAQELRRYGSRELRKAHREVIRI